MLQKVQPQHASFSAQRSRGSARLTIKSSLGKSRIENLFQDGCARIRIPKTHTGDALEAVMINTAGGMTGGDHIDWHFETGDNTNAVITTQACERIYKSTGGNARTDVKIKLNNGSSFAWLPQETILFDQSQFKRDISVDMAASSKLLFVESVVFGRAMMDETVEEGSIQDRWQFCCDGQLFHAEHFKLSDPINEQLKRVSIANDHIAMATLVLVSPTAEAKLAQARDLIGECGGASYFEIAKTGKLLARVLGKDSYELRKTLIPLIALLNDGATLPKCWSL